LPAFLHFLPEKALFLPDPTNFLPFSTFLSLGARSRLLA
jgi:hypothetical protein